MCGILKGAFEIIQLLIDAILLKIEILGNRRFKKLQVVLSWLSEWIFVSDIKTVQYFTLLVLCNSI